MFSRLGLIVTRVFRAVMPDPFTIAVLLTLLTAVLALTVGDFLPHAADPPRAPASVGERALRLLDAWRGEGGVWAFLAFAMQMALVLATGHALAAARPVQRVIARLADLPRGTASASAMVAAAACLTAVVNWGLGLIVGALLARETGRSLVRRRIPARYPLVVAAGYTGLMVWHGGLSGSAPLSMTTLEGARKVLRPELLERLYADGIPLSQTTFSAMNVVITGGLLVLVPAVMALLAPREEADSRTTSPLPFQASPRPGTGTPDEPTTFSDRLDRSPVLAWLLALACVLAASRSASVVGLMRLGLNEVNLYMLALGLALHGSIRAYAQAFEDAARGCAGILLQFPLYGGIMGMMAVSGLVRQFAEGVADIATPVTLPALTFLSAAGLNLFIPSGGGQWGVQGPVALETAMSMGVDPGRIVMAVAYGDQLTNMLQPFWALPLLAITGVRARDIVGYTTVVMLAGGAWIALGLTVFALFQP